jgi:hypothetical protein
VHFSDIVQSAPHIHEKVLAPADQNYVLFLGSASTPLQHFNAHVSMISDSFNSRGSKRFMSFLSECLNSIIHNQGLNDHSASSPFPVSVRF